MLCLGYHKADTEKFCRKTACIYYHLHSENILLLSASMHNKKGITHFSSSLCLNLEANLYLIMYFYILANKVSKQEVYNPSVPMSNLTTEITSRG